MEIADFLMVNLLKFHGNVEVDPSVVDSRCVVLAVCSLSYLREFWHIPETKDGMAK